MSLFLIVSASIVVIVFLLAAIAVRLNSKPAKRRSPSSLHDPHHPLWLPAMPMTDSHHSSISHRHDSEQPEAVSHDARVHFDNSSQQDCGGPSSSFDSGFSSGFDSSSSFDSGSSGGGSSGCD